MTDKELVQLAARAVGYHMLGSWDGSWGCLTDYEGWTFDPLNDDGDAMRLAVRLELEIINDGYTVTARQRNPHKYGAYASISTDPYEATRRAIVLAAAEIGRNMK